MIILEEEILQLYLELHSLSPNQKEWSSEKFKDNPPRLYRYENMCAIAKALHIPVSDFSDNKWFGEFIGEKQITRWDDIEVLVRKNFDCTLTYIQASDKLNVFTLKNMFEFLMDIALNYQSNIDLKEHIILASGYNAVNLEILQNVAKKNKAYIKEVKEILFLLINPNDITCPKPILIEEFGYKDIDFEELDFDWI